MKKYELLAPAGDLEKLKIAILYGADAVFVGGKQYSLRKKASNFSIDDLKEAVIFANAHNAKVYVTVNMVLIASDFVNLDKYLLDLSDIGVHAIIVSSIYIIKRAKELKCKFEVHLSTQQSICNIDAIKYFYSLGVKRIVLGRELSIEQIKEIKANSLVDLEVFIHGGMCSSFSGRCTLSNVMANRDANRGGCAHSCRWKYFLYQKGQLVNEKPIVFASCDLMSVDYIEQLLDMGINSFKIEGRMKSMHYIATIVSAYRKLIDAYQLNGSVSKNDVSISKKNIKKAENRITYSGFFNSKIKNEALLLQNGEEKAIQNFLGIVIASKDKDGFILVEQRNNFKGHRKVEIYSPNGQSKIIKINNLYDDKGIKILVANHARQIVKIKVIEDVMVNSLIRSINNGR